jgi:hypothetical protein
MLNIDWHETITAYKTQPKEYPMEYGEWAEPYALELACAYEKGEITNEGVLDEEIATIEAKLNVKFPPSYLAFLKYSNGLLLPDRFTNLLPLKRIDWFYTLNQEWVDIWNEDEDNVEDEKYFVYGKEQDSCHMRNQYLKTALQISDSAEGDVLLLNPEVKFGEEWEAWWFGDTLAGAIRFQSFQELLLYLLKPEEEQEPISYEEYAKLIEKDQEKLASMEENLFSSIVLGMQKEGLGSDEILLEFEKELAETKAMTQEMLERVNEGLKEEDKVVFKESDEAFFHKLKETIDKTKKV